MSVNKHLPHVLVLPEDPANLELATGFHNEVDWARQRQMQVLQVADGWMQVLRSFESVHVREMERWVTRYMVLLIDFDGQQGRLADARARIPPHLADRVFVIGSGTEPEDLKPTLGTFETIGSALAKDCRNGTDTTWGHALLRNNAGELARLRQQVRPILF